MADKTIGDLPSVTIGDLPSIADLYDDTLIPVEQQGVASKMTGSQWKNYAQASASSYANQAAESAKQATQAASDAEVTLSNIGTALNDAKSYRDQAVTAKTGAEAARDAANTAKTEAQTHASAAKQSETNAADSATSASKSKEAAENAAQEADASKASAETAENNALAAESAAVAAQKAAETARSGAEDAETAASKSATQAAASATTAQQYSGKPPIIQDGYWWTWNASRSAYENTGKRAVLNFDITYPSVAAMNADLSQDALTLAIIQSDVETADNAKLYIFDGTKWNYLADLSGFTGVGVENVVLTSGNHAAGTTDTYTMTLTDGRKITFTVYNGANGEGSGDMLASTYDPTGKSQDIFAYTNTTVSNATKNLQTKLTFDDAPKADSSNPVKSGGIYTALQNVSIDMDAAPTANSQNAVTSGGVYTALQDIQLTPGPQGETGPTGPAGPTGAAGENGKSAYQSAQDGGYTGTETTFYKDLADVSNKVPNSRKINLKALNADITLSASDVGAADAAHQHEAGDITSGVLPVARGGTGVSNLSGTDYGTYRVRAVAFSASEPSAIPNGYILGVYE